MKELICKIWEPINKLCSMLPEWVINLCVRVLLFRVFWLAAQTKISGLTVFGQHFAFWGITPSTFELFEWEYNVPLLPSNIATYMGTFGEFFLSLMILLGFMTRFAAIGLVVMTLVIFSVYPEFWWKEYAFWLLLSLYLIRNGGGKVSVDRYLFDKQS